MLCFRGQILQRNKTRFNRNSRRHSKWRARSVSCSNDITEIKANVFSNLAKCTHLYLGRNEISRIEAGAFEGLDNLKYLDLRNNSLESLGLEVLDDLPRPLELDLEGNVFDCDNNSVGCHLRKEEDEKTITFVSEPSCTDGRTLFLNTYTCGGKCYLFISARGRVSRLSLSFGHSWFACLLWLTIPSGGST